jgi:hypothetical protein
MQVCHGKREPLACLRPGDGVVYYSPTGKFHGGDKVQAFTAIGRVGDDEPYRFDMGGGFTPYRRAVAWEGGRIAPIKPLLPVLAFTVGRSNWGYAFRFGLFPIDQADFIVIEAAMQPAQGGRPICCSATYPTAP